MTDSTRSDLPNEASLPFHPSDVLFNVGIAFLAPMFLGVSGGDAGLARTAAIETVRSYGVRSHADLVMVAEAVAFGLAALNALSLSLSDDLPVTVTMRLQSNA